MKVKNIVTCMWVSSSAGIFVKSFVQVLYSSEYYTRNKYQRILPNRVHPGFTSILPQYHWNLLSVLVRSFQPPIRLASMGQDAESAPNLQVTSRKRPRFAGRSGYEMRESTILKRRSGGDGIETPRVRCIPTKRVPPWFGLFSLLFRAGWHRWTIDY